MCYPALAERDLTYRFIDGVEARFPAEARPPVPAAEEPGSGLEEAETIRRAFGIRDINLVKPGIGEATRVLLRRLPWKVLVRSMTDFAHLGHLYQLAEEKGAVLEEYPLRRYRACGLIRDLGDV